MTIKISKRSWHYRLVMWNNSTRNLPNTRNGYLGQVIVCILAIIFLAWWVLPLFWFAEGMSKLLRRVIPKNVKVVYVDA